MNYRSRFTNQITLPTKLISSKDKINSLYSHLNPDTPSTNTRSSFGIPCSDQKLLLYGVQAKVFNSNPKPTDLPSKLKEAKRNLLNNTLEDTCSFNNKRKLNQFPKTFQEKYCELARYTGNEIVIPNNNNSRITSYTPSKVLYRPSKVSKPETKAEKIKQEIMNSFNRMDNSYSSHNKNHDDDYYNNSYYSLNKYKDVYAFKQQNGIIDLLII